MGLLSVERTAQNLPIKIIGLTTQVNCKTKGGKETKMYILLFRCSLTRAIYLERLPNQSTQEFIMALKRLIARRGKGSVIYLGNA